MSKCPFSNERNCGFCGQSVPEYLAVCGCGYQRAVQRVEEISQENKKLNDFSQGLVAINLSLADQVNQLRDELKQSKVFNKDHFSNLTNVIRSREVLRAKNEKLETELKELRAKISTATHTGFDTESITALNKIIKALDNFTPNWVGETGYLGDKAARSIRKLYEENLHNLQSKKQIEIHAKTLESQNEKLQTELKELREKTSITMGVGSGDGKLFVRGDYESIKAAQAIVFENEKLRKENADLTGRRNEYFACLQEEITRRGRLQSQLREAKAECAKLKQINHDVNERAEKIWLMFNEKDNRIVSNCLTEIFELLEKASPGWTQALEIEQRSCVYTIKKLIEDAQKFRSLTLITGHTVIGDQRYICMRKVGKYFYQEYKPS